MEDERLNEIKIEITELKNIVISLNERMIELIEIIELQQKESKKMSNHIDFVENIYDKVKAPFNYIMDKVDNMSKNKMIKN